MYMQYTQYVLLFLVLVIYSDGFKLYGVTHSYSIAARSYVFLVRVSVEGFATHCYQLWNAIKRQLKCLSLTKHTAQLFSCLTLTVTLTHDPVASDHAYSMATAWLWPVPRVS